MPNLRQFAALLILAVCMAGAALAGPPLTTIQDTLYNADGSPFNGVLFISWAPFTAADTSAIGAQALAVNVIGGYINIQLVPTTNALSPASYSVRYYSSGKNQFNETWAVPPSTFPVRLQDVRTSPGPLGPPPGDTTIPISDVQGLSTELSLRPTIGPAFATGRTAVIDSLGDIDGASGNPPDCLHVDGSSAPCATGQGDSTFFADNETPSGVQNGVNPTFTLANAPVPSTSLTLFRNGLLLRPSVDYTVSGNVITFSSSDIPQSSDVLLGSYRYGASLPGVTFVDLETPSGNVNGVNTIFTLANTPNPSTSVALYRNGLRQKPGLDYTFSGNTITFQGVATPQPGDILLASYRM